MTRYRVRWEIGVEAGNPLDAARAARETQTRPGTTATCFDVLEYPRPDRDRVAVVAVDLGGPGEVPLVNGRPLRRQQISPISGIVVTSCRGVRYTGRRCTTELRRSA